MVQVNKLIAAGADPALALKDTASVPLFAAVRSGHTEVVKVSYMRMVLKSHLILCLGNGFNVCNLVPNCSKFYLNCHLIHVIGYFGQQI